MPVRPFHPWFRGLLARQLNSSGVSAPRDQRLDGAEQGAIPDNRQLHVRCFICKAIESVDEGRDISIAVCRDSSKMEETSHGPLIPPAHRSLHHVQHQHRIDALALLCIEYTRAVLQR